MADWPWFWKVLGNFFFEFLFAALLKLAAFDIQLDSTVLEKNRGDFHQATWI